MSLEIKTFGTSVLRKKAQEVQQITPELIDLAHEMLETMYEAPGIGLAAPQVGHSIRLIVVDVSPRPDEEEGDEFEWIKDPYIMFNPEISPVVDSPDTEYEEGCLSVPDIFANVIRPSTIHVSYTNADGQRVELKNVEGLFARCIMHEIDHLDGVLFVDKISPADRAMNQSKLKKMARDNKGK
jgi:peptide deformylase